MHACSGAYIRRRKTLDKPFNSGAKVEEDASCHPYTEVTTARLVYGNHGQSQGALPLVSYSKKSIA